MDYLKIGKATDLSGKERKWYRILEILPGFLSLGTLFILILLSWLKPVWVAYFLIAFDVYWLLLVIFLAIYLLAGFKQLKKYKAMDWRQQCENLKKQAGPVGSLSAQSWVWEDLTQLIILPTYNEDLAILRTALMSLVNDGWPTEKMIVVLAMEERAGQGAYDKARVINEEFASRFGEFLITFHPGDITGEIKGKGANQAYAAQAVKEKIIDPKRLEYNKILVSVFDIDTVVHPGYFFRLANSFLTVLNPYHASYQPIPVYHNNVWQAPFFARVASSSNTFWQMMQQIRPEKLATYSSHSMTWQALVDIGFWGVNMVSEDSRIFWHCFLYYEGDYRVEPLYFPVYMDTTMDQNFWQTAKSLYKQQRRWAWGSENVPYLIFNAQKKWPTWKKRKGAVFRHIFVQVYGFHSWATNALIVGVIGWLPQLLGGDRFNSTVLSGNIPVVTTWLMNLAMIGMILSAAISSIMLPKRPKGYKWYKSILVVVEWVFVPFSIIVFGAIPCLDAQIRLARGKYMGFWVTPKARQ